MDPAQQNPDSASQIQKLEESVNTANLPPELLQNAKAIIARLKIV